MMDITALTKNNRFNERKKRKKPQTNNNTNQTLIIQLKFKSLVNCIEVEMHKRQQLDKTHMVKVKIVIYAYIYILISN